MKTPKILSTKEVNAIREKAWETADRMQLSLNVLRVVAGLTYTEMAAWLGVSDETIRHWSTSGMSTCVAYALVTFFTSYGNATDNETLDTLLNVVVDLDIEHAKLEKLIRNIEVAFPDFKRVPIVYVQARALFVARDELDKLWKANQ